MASPSVLMIPHTYGVTCRGCCIFFVIDGDHSQHVYKGRLLTMRRKKNKNLIAHREGRTRSLQMPLTRKSLTLYPIELGGRHISITC